MLNTLIAFTDVHGIPHTAACFELSYGYMNESTTTTVGQSPAIQPTIGVTYVFKYWHSEEAKSAGCLPCTFVNKQGLQNFDTTASPEEVTDLELFCINHFITHVLPLVDATASVVPQE